MTNEYNVIGEHKDNDRHLLVVGDDGRHYDYSLDSDAVSPVDPDERWQVDEEPPDAPEIEDGSTAGTQKEP
jgi:hypothetical protein